LVKLGALDSSRVVHNHQGWRLITCIWLHAGVFHILANMLSLLFIGVKLEQEFGLCKRQLRALPIDLFKKPSLRFLMLGPMIKLSENQAGWGGGDRCR
jgi:membrane associated rhomboid family serine protease